MEGFVYNQLDDVNIWYRLSGGINSEVITLIPGSEFPSVYWSEEIISTLLSEGYSVLIFDPRDTGRSTWICWPKGFKARKWNPGDPTPYPFEAHYEDLKILWQHLGIKQSHIIGVSQGGMIAQMASIQNPEAVKSLCLLSTSPTNQFDKDLDPLPPNFFKPVPEMMTRVGIQASMSFLFGKHYLKSLTDAFMYLLQADESHRNDVYQCFRKVHEWNGYNVKSGQGFAYVNQKSRINDLAKIKAETLILHGDRDKFFSVKHTNALHKGISNSKLIIIKGGLHAIPVNMYHPYLPDIINNIKSN